MELADKKIKGKHKFSIFCLDVYIVNNQFVYKIYKKFASISRRRWVETVELSSLAVYIKKKK